MIMNNLLMDNPTYRSVLKVNHSDVQENLGVAEFMKRSLPDLEKPLVAEQQIAPKAFHWNTVPASSVHSIDAVIRNITKLAHHFSPLDYEVFMGKKPSSVYKKTYAIIANYQGTPIAGMEVTLD